MNVKQATLLLKNKGYDVTKELGKSTSSRTLMVVSDMHVGSIYAVCSQEPVINETGQEFKLDYTNKRFLEHWMDCRDWCPNPHVLICNGEPFNGPNQKEHGFQNWSSDMTDQVDDSEKLLRCYNPRAYAFTRGSNYHVKDKNTNYEEMLAHRLKTLSYSAYVGRERHFKESHRVNDESVRQGQPQRFTDYFMFFKIHGQLCNFTHHVGYTSKHALRGGALNAEMAAMIYEKGHMFDIDDDVNILGRGHVHYYVEIHHPSTIGFTTPAWKLPDGFLFRKGMGGARPHVGAIKVIIEQNGHVIVDKLLMRKKFPRPYIPDWTEL